MATKEVDYSVLWTPELIVSAWLTSGFILMTTSLIFYHLTKSNTLEMGRGIAGIYATLLILAAVVVTICGIMVYLKRTRLIHDKQPQDDLILNHEKIFRRIYTFIFFVVVLVEIGIAHTIIVGSMKSTNPISNALPVATSDPF